MATTCQVHLPHIWPVYGRLCTSLRGRCSSRRRPWSVPLRSLLSHGTAFG